MIRCWKTHILVLAALLLQGCATSMLSAPCDQPKVSNSSVPFVYLIMLPYSYRGADASSVHAEAARDLNEVASLEAMRMAVETSNMHVTLLQDKGGGCGIEQVYGAFSGGGSGLSTKLLSSVVFYWGEVFQENDSVLVQSHVRVLWNGNYERLLHVDVGSTSDGGVFRFTGHMPHSTISFPPRRLPVGNKAGGSASLKAQLRARVAPTLDAEFSRVPERFLIAKRKGDWLELRDLSGTHEAESVWVSVNSNDDTIKAVLPELSFAHALAAYANFRTAGSSEVARDARRWLKAFRQGYPDSSDPLLRKPLASADVIEGALTLAQRDASLATRTRAHEFFNNAALALPSDSTVLNLSAISGIAQCCTSREDASRIQQRLELARQLDVGDEEIAKNLLTWYKLIRTRDMSVWPVPSEELLRRSEALSNILR